MTDKVKNLNFYQYTHCNSNDNSMMGIEKNYIIKLYQCLILYIIIINVQDIHITCNEQLVFGWLDSSLARR